MQLVQSTTGPGRLGSLSHLRRGDTASSLVSYSCTLSESLQQKHVELLLLEGLLDVVAALAALELRVLPSDPASIPLPEAASTSSAERVLECDRPLSFINMVPPGCDQPMNFPLWSIDLDIGHPPMATCPYHDTKLPSCVIDGRNSMGHTDTELRGRMASGGVVPCNGDVLILCEPAQSKLPRRSIERIIALTDFAASGVQATKLPSCPIDRPRECGRRASSARCCSKAVALLSLGRKPSRSTCSVCINTGRSDSMGHTDTELRGRMASGGVVPCNGDVLILCEPAQSKLPRRSIERIIALTDFAASGVQATKLPSCPIDRPRECGRRASSARCCSKAVVLLSLGHKPSRSTCSVCINPGPSELNNGRRFPALSMHGPSGRSCAATKPRKDSIVIAARSRTCILGPSTLVRKLVGNLCTHIRDDH